MKIKTTELTDLALDWAVRESLDMNELFEAGLTEGIVPAWRPSTNWSQGGPIIEQELIELTVNGESLDGMWVAKSPEGYQFASGPTPLIAAMRCFVVSRLGDEVDIPEELK